MDKNENIKNEQNKKVFKDSLNMSFGKMLMWVAGILFGAAVVYFVGFMLLIYFAFRGG